MKKDLELDNKTLIVTIIGLKGYDPEDTSTHNVHPYMHEAYQQLKQVLEEKKIEYVDGVQLFKEELPMYEQKVDIFYEDVHFNGLGNALFAKAIHNKVVQVTDVDLEEFTYSFQYDDPSGIIEFVDESGNIVDSIYSYEILSFAPVGENIFSRYYAKRIATFDGEEEVYTLS